MEYTKSERKRIGRLNAIAFDRVIYYYTYVAKLKMKAGCDVYFAEVSKKIGIGLYNAEKKLNKKYSDLNVISIINEVINEIDFNLNYPPSETAAFISSFVRFEEDPNLRIISWY